jgi:ACT domain-containing protein
MKAKQKVDIYDVPKLVKQRGMRMDHFLKQVGISRVHFYLIRTGERPLVEERKQRIKEILNIEL